MSKDVKLLLPEVLYAVEGMELNIYFQNMITVINADNYAFEVEFPFGRCGQKRFFWTPEAEHVGEHTLTLSVWDDDGLCAQAQTKIIVSPRNAGESKTLTILQVGASCMAAKGHGEALLDRFQAPGNPRLVMLGSHAPGYGPVQEGGPANEAFGGWTWRTFFDKTKTNQLDNDGLHPARPWDVPSPFLVERNNRHEFDFAHYIETVCHGVKPDVIYTELGINGVFMVKSEEEFEDKWEKNFYPYMKKMFDGFRRVLPDVILGVELVPRGAASQDAFGKNYGCAQSRRRWMLNAHILYSKYIEFAKEFDYYIIPEYHNYDTEANYPVLEEFVHENTMLKTFRQGNALHPKADGFGQWADCEYAFLKYLLAQGKI